MSKYQEVSHIKVHLQDVLEYIDEVLEDRRREVFGKGVDATDNEIRHALGVVKGLELALQRLQYNFGDEQVSEELFDTRY